jgi:hypothetical protein
MPQEYFAKNLNTEKPSRVDLGQITTKLREFGLAALVADGSITSSDEFKKALESDVFKSYQEKYDQLKAGKGEEMPAEDYNNAMSYGYLINKGVRSKGNTIGLRA